MAAPRRKPEKSTVQVSFWMTAEEKAAAVAAAAACGVSLSELLRSAVSNYSERKA